MPNPWSRERALAALAGEPETPTFEDVRARAYRELGDLLDTLSVLPAEYADWPTRDQLDALRDARRHIGEAREALNRAADG